MKHNWNQDHQEKYQLPQICRWHHPYGRKWGGTKESLDEGEKKKAGLKLNIQKTKIMASGPITSWQIHVETMETVTDLIFLSSKITADGDCSREITRCLLLGRKDMRNLDSILKGRDITLPSKGHIVKAMIFLAVMYGCESWTIKKAECQRIDAFELWCWRRLLRVPWTARRSNQSILKEISPEYLLEGLMLKLQNFGHLMKRVNSLEKTLMLGKIEGRRRRGRQRMRWLDDMKMWVWANSGRWWWTGKPDTLLFMRLQRATEQQSSEQPWELSTIITVIPFYRSISWGKEVRQLPKVIQLVSDRDRIWTLVQRVLLADLDWQGVEIKVRS